MLAIGLGEGMSAVYCMCVDYREGPTIAQRKSFSVITSADDRSYSGCGVGLIDFGGGDRCLLVTATADSQQDARTKLSSFMKSQGWQPVPFPIDYVKAQLLLSESYSHIRSCHIITALCEHPNSVDLSEIKREVSRRIEQNMKWNRKFLQLRQRIDEYLKTEDPESYIELMDQCARLHVLPEHCNAEAEV